MKQPINLYGTYGKMDNLTLTYNGNRLTGVSEATADYDFAGSFEYKRANGSQYLYNANGSLIADKSRGIAYITYAPNGTPQKIYFTNGNVTKYRYNATGQKLSVEYYVAAPNVTVAFGTEPDALTQSQTMYAGSRQYLLGGSLVMEDGMIDRFLFNGGYASASMTSPTTYTFSFYYYNQDHLGNNREVVDSAGTVKQITHYYPFGTPYADPSTILNPSLQPYKYNGKELDRMHGLDTYDYGARQYAPILGRWDRMDPLCEKYYAISPYAYCANNPIMLVDPDGKEIIPKLWRKSTEKGTVLVEKYRSMVNFVNAMTAFGKTTWGKHIISSFVPQGYTHYGVKGNGKYGDIDLIINEYNIDNPQLQARALLSKGVVIGGSFSVRKGEDNKLCFVMKIDASVKESEMAETIVHELTLHGATIDKIVSVYRNQGVDAAIEFAHKSSEEQEHRNNKWLYEQTKKELLHINPEYSQSF